MPFTPDGAFPVQLLPDGRVRTLAGVRWTGHRGDAVDIPAGTVSDGATRPVSTAAVVEEWGPATRAFLVHDVLCEALRAYREDVAAATGRPGALVVRPAFDAVDTDAVLRLVLRELGAGAVLARVYWTGVRWSALFSPWRRAGWVRTLLPLLAWTPLVAVIVGPAALGAWTARALLTMAETVAWPFTRRRPARLEHTPPPPPPSTAHRRVRPYCPLYLDDCRPGCAWTSGHGCARNEEPA